MEYVLQLLVALLCMLIGFAGDLVLDHMYYAAPFRQLALCSIVAAGVGGYILTRFRPRKSAVFVWIPGVLLFSYIAASLASAWSPAWAPSSRLSYVWNGLFGPDCTSQECIYTLAADVFLSSIVYSITARIALARWQTRAL